MVADIHELLERYEAVGGEGDDDLYADAQQSFARAMADHPDDPALLRDYGYLLECHARYALRRAATQYERALAIDPDMDKVRYQLISARAALGEDEQSIGVYRDRLAAVPDDVRGYRLLASAHHLAREYDQAAGVIDEGLRRFPDDAPLLAVRGATRRDTGDPRGALADWRRSHHLDPDDLGPIYESAFLLEAQGQVAEAIDAWRYILEWNRARGYEVQMAWPAREIERLATR
jgi:tetratricopeptide (TPR) repeat protein